MMTKHGTRTSAVYFVTSASPSAKPEAKAARAEPRWVNRQSMKLAKSIVAVTGKSAATSRPWAMRFGLRAVRKRANTPAARPNSRVAQTHTVASNSRPNGTSTPTRLHVRMRSASKPEL